MVAFVAGDDQGGANAGGGAGAGHRPFHYEGPTDFDRISTFLGDLAKGGNVITAGSQALLEEALAIMAH